jgi:hypothetical protein
MLTSLMVRALKGAPISILVILMIEQKACSQEYLRRCSGYSDENIHDAMLLLKEHDLVVQVGRYEWSLTAGAKQLPLGALLESDDESEGDPDPDPKEQIDVECDDSGQVSSDIIGPNPSSSGSSFNYPESKNKKQPLPDLERCSSGKSGPNRRESDNLSMLDAFSIREPARTRLARLPHVTPELIEYHCRRASKTGSAIHRIENDWPMDDPPKTESKYYEGEFGDFVEH